MNLIKCSKKMENNCNLRGTETSTRVPGAVSAFTIAVLGWRQTKI